jgi:hypothetical protein
MGIFDIFTGAPAKKAAEQQRGYLSGIGTQNTAAVDSGLNSSLAALGQGYDTGTQSINQGYGDASGFLNQGATAARSAYDPLTALGGKYGGATTMALNSLGVNGQAGTDAARSAFQAGPAYQWNMDQGLEGINRRRAAGGMLNSGNADRDAQTFGAGLASNEYNNWMQQLLGFTNPELGATAGAASGLAGIETGLGQNQANLANNRGTMLADLAKVYGQNQMGANMGAAGMKVGANTQLAQPYANTYKQEADAQTAGSGAMWGGLLGLANIGTQPGVMKKMWG